MEKFIFYMLFLVLQQIGGINLLSPTQSLSGMPFLVLREVSSRATERLWKSPLIKRQIVKSATNSAMILKIDCAIWLSKARQPPAVKGPPQEAMGEF